MRKIVFCCVKKCESLEEIWNICIFINVLFLLQMATSDPDTYSEPQPGDLIEIFRPAYQHWALYLGDGYIVNLTPIGECLEQTPPL